MVLVDGDEATLVGRHAGGWQAQVVGDGGTPGRDQQAPAMDLLPGRGRHQHASGAAFDGDRVLLEDLDATAGERGPHHLAELGFGGWCEPADQAHLTAEVGEDLGLLHADVPAADHHDRLRQPGQLHRRGRREVLDGVDPRQVRDRRSGARRDQVAFSCRNRPAPTMPT